MVEYSPDMQEKICNQRELCYFGKFPTLASIGKQWGKSTATAWLVPQIANLSEFCGCKNKITVNQIKECATLIAQNYYYLKVSEIMLFFNRFKQGKYGHFYGTVDPLTIMTALQTFLRERGDAYFDHEAELNRRKEEEDRKKFFEEMNDPEKARIIEEHKKNFLKMFGKKTFLSKMFNHK